MSQDSTSLLVWLFTGGGNGVLGYMPLRFASHGMKRQQCAKKGQQR